MTNRMTDCGWGERAQLKDFISASNNQVWLLWAPWLHHKYVLCCSDMCWKEVLRPRRLLVFSMCLHEAEMAGVGYWCVEGACSWWSRPWYFMADLLCRSEVGISYTTELRWLVLRLLEGFILFSWSLIIDYFFNNPECGIVVKLLNLITLEENSVQKASAILKYRLKVKTKLVNLGCGDI